MDQTELPYQVKIENFEGPLDLLLHLIKKNEINIYDIPIALIAQQYLDYLSVMKDLNLTVAGEFLVMASSMLTLIDSSIRIPPLDPLPQPLKRHARQESPRRFRFETRARP